MAGIYSEEEEDNIAKHSRIRESLIDKSFKIIETKFEKDPTTIPSKEIRLLNETMNFADLQIQTTATIKAKTTETEQNAMMLGAVAEVLKSNTDRLVGVRKTPIDINVELPDVAKILVPGIMSKTGTEIPDLEHFKEISRKSGMEDDTE